MIVTGPTVSRMTTEIDATLHCRPDDLRVARKKRARILGWRWKGAVNDNLVKMISPSLIYIGGS